MLLDHNAPPAPVSPAIYSSAAVQRSIVRCRVLPFVLRYCVVRRCAFFWTYSRSTRYDTGTRYHFITIFQGRQPWVWRISGQYFYYVRIVFSSHVLPFRTWHRQASSAEQLALHKHLLATFFHRSSFSLLSSTLYWFFHFVNYYCIFFVLQ